MKKNYERSGLIMKGDMRNLSVKLGYAFLIGFVILMTLIAIFPIVWAFFSGFKDLNEYYSPDVTFLPKTFDFGKITSAWSKLDFASSLANSVIYFAGAWFCEVIIGGLAGYTISRLKPKGSQLFFRLMLWTMMMPHTLSMVPMFMTWTDLKMINTFWPLIIPCMADSFRILLFKNFFDKIPESYIESARIDGCTNVGIFFKIIVPLSLPIISLVSVDAFKGTWNDFMGPFLYLKDAENTTVALKLFQISKEYTEPEQMLCAFLIMVPSVIVFMICAKQIFSNDMSVGVKE